MWNRRFFTNGKQNNWNVSGIEPNEQAREIANKKTNNSVFEIEQLLKFKESSFDVITLWHVLRAFAKFRRSYLLFLKDY